VGKKAMTGVFIGATGQNVGKTTTCLGVLSGLKKRLNSVGFIKPVGQRHIEIEPGVMVDKDVALFKDRFNLSTNYSDMSPVIIPAGFTRDYLDKVVTHDHLAEKIRYSYELISSTHEFTVVEGTGHVGVGSIIGLNNAKVAAELGLEMIIIVSGGLGSAFDELAMNISLCHEHKVPIRGVILNRVLPDKREMILNYFPKALEPLNIPLLGAIPYTPFLSEPTVYDFQQLLQVELLSGHRHRFRHFKKHRIGARSLEAFRELLEPQLLIITPASREDLIEMVLDHHDNYQRTTGKDFEGGLILTGKRVPSESIMKRIRESDVPVLNTSLPSYDALGKITSFIAKIQQGDICKIEQAIQVVEAHLDFSALITPSAVKA
jgi:phosphate acetyltransferase